MSNDSTRWDFEGWWNVVIGCERDALAAVREFSLGPSSVGERLTEWQAEAWEQSLEDGDAPSEWSDHYDRAEKMLVQASERIYVLRDSDSGVTQQIEADDLDDARSQAEDWVEDAADNYDTSGGTFWVDVLIERLDGEHVCTVTVAIEQPEPDCVDGEGHDWQSPVEVVGGLAESPGVLGHGGGITSAACCMRCGCRRVYDSWAQRKDTGEQGLEVTTYTPGYYLDNEEWQALNAASRRKVYMVWGIGAAAAPLVRSADCIVEWDQAPAKVRAALEDECGTPDPEGWIVAVECLEEDLDEQTRFDSAVLGYQEMVP